MKTYYPRKLSQNGLVSRRGDTPPQLTDTQKTNGEQIKKIQGDLQQESNKISQLRDDVSKTIDTQTAYKQQVDTKVKELENSVQASLDSMDSRNQTMFAELEKKLEDKLDKIMEQRVLKISQVVGDAITAKIMRAMDLILRKRTCRRARISRTKFT